MCHTRSRSRTRHILKHRITLIGTKNSYLFVLPVDVKLPYIDYKLFSTRYTLQGLFKFARTQIIDYTHIQEHIYIYRGVLGTYHIHIYIYGMYLVGWR